MRFGSYSATPAATEKTTDWYRSGDFEDAIVAPDKPRLSSRPTCPSLAQNITWRSYGRFLFGDAGDDAVARKIVDDCGWHIFGGHNALWDTLEIASANEEVVFVWAFNGFTAFRVSKGWTGKTERGAKLGDSAATFRSLYPEFNIEHEGWLSFQMAISTSGLILIGTAHSSSSLWVITLSLRFQPRVRRPLARSS
jgi:hypothetical protein